MASSDLQKLWLFILKLNEAVEDKQISSVSVQNLSPTVQSAVRLLTKLRVWVSEIPPVNRPVRFGNPSFRTWHAKLVSESRPLLLDVLASNGTYADPEIADELSPYLETSFGNDTRIDYGTGHELRFCVLLHLLTELKVFDQADYPALVLVVFKEYLETCRVLQTEYMLEPAGSHGVWGLDDYSFLPFLWGSSQLRNTASIKPTVISDISALNEKGHEYLYLEAIAFIRRVKKGPFHEHSPMLFDISRIHGGWPKINQGMLKMYKGEVFQKVPVMQDMLFGTLFPFPETGVQDIPSTDVAQGVSASGIFPTALTYDGSTGSSGSAVVGDSSNVGLHEHEPSTNKRRAK